MAGTAKNRPTGRGNYSRPAAVVIVGLLLKRCENCQVSDELKDYEAVEDHCDRWLDGVRDLNELVPEVSRVRDDARWALKAFSKRPQDADAVGMSTVKDDAAFARTQVSTLLPALTPFDFQAVQLGVNSIASSTSTGAVQYIAMSPSSVLRLLSRGPCATWRNSGSFSDQI